MEGVLLVCQQRSKLMEIRSGGHCFPSCHVVLLWHCCSILRVLPKESPPCALFNGSHQISSGYQIPAIRIWLHSCLCGDRYSVHISSRGDGRRMGQPNHAVRTCVHCAGWMVSIFSSTSPVSSGNGARFPHRSIKILLHISSRQTSS